MHQQPAQRDLRSAFGEGSKAECYNTDAPSYVAGFRKPATDLGALEVFNALSRHLNLSIVGSTHVT